MSEPLFEVCGRIAAGPVGTSPRKARGPVGIAGRADVLTPFVCSWSLDRDNLTPLWPFGGSVVGPWVPSFFLFSSSISFARFSRASFSRCAFERNFGWK